MTPDTLAKSNSEHGQQRALFAWANVASRYGFEASWDDRSYTVPNYARDCYGVPGVQLLIPALARLYAIPNGGLRDKATAGKLKAEGVKRGVPDIFLPLIVGTWAGLYVELKRPETKKVGTRKAEIIAQPAGATSEAQDDWIGYLRSAGYGVAVAFDWREAAKQIQSYVQWVAKN